MRYLDDFIKLTCAPDLLVLKLFPNTKEITESQAMYHLVTAELIKRGIDRRDQKVCILEIGCGVKPRTSTLFAYRSNWTCFAIDPKVDDSRGYGKRINSFKMRDDEFSKPKNLKFITDNFEVIIIVSVHGHGNPKALYDKIPDCFKKAVFEMPCCFPATLTEGYYKIDREILSPKNMIYWKFSENF